MACVKHPLLTIRAALKRRYAHEMTEVLDKWQLTGMEADVLLFLANNPGCDTASDMVTLCQLTKSHVSKAVDHLTEMGYITQQRDQQNRRKVHLLLTEEAKPVVKAGQAAQKRPCFSHFSDCRRQGTHGMMLNVFHQQVSQKQKRQQLQGIDDRIRQCFNKHMHSFSIKQETTFRRLLICRLRVTIHGPFHPLRCTLFR